MRRPKRRFGFRGRVESMMPERDRVTLSITAVCQRYPELGEHDHTDWFGWELPDQPERYAAVGVGTRGFVVDAISGHIIWAGDVLERKKLPRSLADISR